MYWARLWSEQNIVDTLQYFYNKTDFTISPPADESTPIKPIKTKRKPIGNLENIIEFKAEKPMSNTATMLQKVIGNDLLVLTYDRARKKLKLMHSPVNLDEYKNIVARVEVKLLIINDNLNKELKSSSKGKW